MDQQNPHEEADFDVLSHDKVSMAELQRATGSRGERIKTWLLQAGCDFPTTRDHWDEYIAIIRKHQEYKTAKDIRSPEEKALSQVSSLEEDWDTKKKMEECRRLARENEIAERVLAEEWMLVSVHHQVIASLTEKLESVPDKAKAELGLSGPQRDKLRNMLDQARSDAAAQIRQALSKAKEQAKKDAV